MVSEIERLTSVLKKVLFEVPYSSAASMYNIAGKDYPMRFGENCIFQSKELKRRLESEGYENLHFLRDSLLGHLGLLWDSGENNYFLDPYLMFEEPINLDDILNSPGRKMKFRAYPSIGEETSHINIIFPYENGTFRILKSWPGSDRVVEFEFDMDSKNEDIPLPEEYLGLMFNPNRTTHSIRLLDTVSRRTDHLMYPIREEDSVSEQEIYIKTNEGVIIPFQDTDRFFPMLDAITKRLGTNKEELLAFMVTAAELYHEFCPVRD